MTSTHRRTAIAGVAAAIAIAGTWATPAYADLVLSQVVVDMLPNAAPRVDVEASNTGKERMYVVAEPSEIVDPGKPEERRQASPDPAVTGLLVTPQKMILEPGERKLLRIAAVAPRGARDRIYRVTVKPVTGEITAAGSALKVLVGYDMLVIVRPTVLSGTITGQRNGASLALANTGSTNVEIYDGRQCDANGKDCRALPPKRLYAGASWTQSIDPARRVDYKIKTSTIVENKSF
ncbi:fimbrial biogenesis chaperone [Sphingomonas faeni]|uniref:fimbrial biogenesis chaperone n=1 Tax=Sphingomonas faeni TaxID=185950 RepID=UPI00278A679A|nr:fimbria/pilus periplasmic chaperone [Sphingomonas faeni]MDQ0837406.1 P pilus assembly chaperone PapD [Sphingomonas faeni]